jgi:uncharacterized protein
MLRKMVLSIVLADNYISHLVQKPFGTKWVLEGDCNKCGKCCLDIHLKIEPKLLNNAFTRELVVRWISWLFVFYLKRIDYDRNYLVFGCNNLNSNGTCNDYNWRPNVCRNYPLVDYFEEPVLFKECGYKAKLKA